MSDQCANLVCLDQLIEPDPTDTFVVVNNNGSLAFFEMAVTVIASGATQVVVVFAAEKASLNYTFNELAVENTADTSPLNITAEITSRTTKGFTASLSAATDSGNYQLHWTVEVTNL